MKTLNIALASVLAIGLSGAAVAGDDPIKAMSDAAGYDNQISPYSVSQQRSLDKEAIDENPWLTRVDHDISNFATAATAEDKDDMNERGGFNFEQLY